MSEECKLPPLELPEPLKEFIQPWLEEATEGLGERETIRMCAEVCAHSLQTYAMHLAAGMNEYDAALEAQLALGIPDATSFTWSTKREVRKPWQTLDEWLAIAVIGPDNEVSRRFRDEVRQHYSALYDRFRAEGLDEFAACDKAVEELGSPYEAQRRFVKMSTAAGHPTLDSFELESLRKASAAWSSWLRVPAIVYLLLILLGFYWRIESGADWTQIEVIRTISVLTFALYLAVPAILNGHAPRVTLFVRAVAWPIFLPGAFIWFAEDFATSLPPGRVLALTVFGMVCGFVFVLINNLRLYAKTRRMSDDEIRFWVGPNGRGVGS